MNALVEYIKTHPNWRTELTQKPYCLTIKDKGPYTIFSYSQIDSDFYNEIVRVSRGIILRIQECPEIDGDTRVKIVCWPFNKFSNYGEGYADKIDWASAKVQEKVDGSIIKVWHDDDIWHISTNGMIDAFEADLQMLTLDCASFGDLFVIAASNTCNGYEDFLDKLDQNYTYIFELTSPWNRVVVPYADTTITHIGSRNLITGLEENIDLGIKKPKEYSFRTFDEVVATAAALPFSQEGYVVVDKDWHRVKIKSKEYLRIHHLKDNSNVNPKRVLELIKTNEQDEFISYFPEYKEHFDKIGAKYTNTVTAINLIKDHVEIFQIAVALDTDEKAKRAGFAKQVMTKVDPKLRKYYFAYYDNDEEKVKKMISDLSYEDLL
jgi:hypothetical protein